MYLHAKYLTVRWGIWLVACFIPNNKNVRQTVVLCPGVGLTRAEEMGKYMNYRISLCMAAAVAIAGVTGCATKNYVKTQTAPIVDHTNQLDDKTAANNRAIHDTDDRANAGITKAQGAADSAS